MVTVGSIHGGTKHNIIPDEVKMQLTVRTYKSDVRDRVIADIERIAKGCAIAAGVPEDRMPIVNHLKNEFTPATYNNPDLTKRLVAVWKKELGDQNVEMVDPTMGGEDFSEVQPSGSLDSGGRFSCRRSRSGQGGRKPEDRSATTSLHSSKFAPVPEPTIRLAITAMDAAVLDLMKK